MFICAKSFHNEIYTEASYLLFKIIFRKIQNVLASPDRHHQFIIYIKIWFFWTQLWYSYNPIVNIFFSAFRCLLHGHNFPCLDHRLGIRPILYFVSGKRSQFPKWNQYGKFSWEDVCGSVIRDFRGTVHGIASWKFK